MGVTAHLLPMVKHTLWECLARCSLTQLAHESEGLEHRQVSLEVVNRGARSLVLGEDVASEPVHGRVDAPKSTLWCCDVHKEDWLEQSRLGSQHACIHAATSGWHDLSTTTVDGISMESHVIQVEAAATHWLLTEHSFLGGPLEVVSQEAATCLGLTSGGDITLVDGIAQLGAHGLSLHVQTIVLVGGLGEAHLL